MGSTEMGTLEGGWWGGGTEGWGEDRELKGMERCEITLMGTRRSRRTEEQIEKRRREKIRRVGT